MRKILRRGAKAQTAAGSFFCGKRIDYGKRRGGKVMESKETKAGKETNDAVALTLTGQKQISLSGVKKVDEFTAESIILTLPDGRLFLSGKELKVIGFSEKEGTFSAAGLVESIRFGTKKVSLMKRIFK